MMKLFFKVCPFVALMLIFSCEKTVYYDDIIMPEFSSGPAVSAITDSSVTVAWVTSEACSCNLEYGVLLDKHYPETVELTEYRQNHSLTVNELWPDVDYFALAKIYDYEGNGPVVSDSIKFSTLSNRLSETWLRLYEQGTVAADSVFALWQQTEPNSKRTRFTEAWLTFKAGNVTDAGNAMALLYVDYPKFLPNLAGLVVINYLLENYSHAIIYAHKLLDINEYWSFVYDGADLNHRYVRLMLAEAEIMEESFAAARVQIDFLWPDNTLDENNSTTWLVDGVSYSSYEAALLAAINYLYKVI